ncbi:hypothetical protein C0993_010572, partial [Termitomyces sp. T159_Od127]
MRRKSFKQFWSDGKQKRTERRMMVTLAVMMIQQPSSERSLLAVMHSKLSQCFGTMLPTWMNHLRVSLRLCSINLAVRHALMSSVSLNQVLSLIISVTRAC